MLLCVLCAIDPFFSLKGAITNVDIRFEKYNCRCRHPFYKKIAIVDALRMSTSAFLFSETDVDICFDLFF